MTDLVVVFETNSDGEASIVRGLLETHGIQSVVSSAVLHAVFPVPIDGLRIAVASEAADEARCVIESYRIDASTGAVVRLRDEFAELERRIGYRFRDAGLLEHALTHTSRAHEDVSGGVFDNESLEFLGDAVLGLIVAEWLFRDCPELDEGEKSKIKATVVSAAALATLGDSLALGEFILLGRGEEKTGGRRKPTLIADALEALIAAIYLDGGLDQARAFVRRHFADLLADASRPDFLGRDCKSALQEIVQARGLPPPEYRVTGEVGPAHRRVFEVEVVVDGEVIAQGSGRSKKDAEQEAARLALKQVSSQSQ